MTNTGTAYTQPPLRVLLVEDENGAPSLLEQALGRAGYHVIARCATSVDLRAEALRLAPDAIIIDLATPDAGFLRQMQAISQEQPCAIVLFAEDDDTETIRRVIASGITAYIYDGLDSRRVRPVVEVAIARFREQQALRAELERTRNSLKERKLIEQAKGLLMRQKSISEDAAYQLLRKMAMDQGLKIGAMARNVIAVVRALD